MAEKLNRTSRRITVPKSQGAAQAMLYAPGLSDGDMEKAQVGIASIWFEGNSCNMHLLGLAERVKRGVVDADLVGFRFNAIGVSDGISMGTEGMSYSLQSRDLIADSIETVMCAQWYDANIALPGCDKNMPGCIMAMGRVNRPSLMIYGGTIKAGRSRAGGPLDVGSAFESYGEFIAGRMDEETRSDVVRRACPGAGACGGMFTANTMASAIEALGMSLPYSASTPAEDPAKLEECARSGPAIRHLLERNIRPSDIMTREAFENAMVMVTVLGGSTNAALHLIAMARSVGVDLGFVMEDLHRAGGAPAVIKLCLERGAMNGDCLTVTGRTLAENVADLPGFTEGQEVIASWDDPIKETGHIQILRGSLAPTGAVAKITGKEGLTFSGPARVFDCEEDMLAALEG